MAGILTAVQTLDGLTASLADTGFWFLPAAGKARLPGPPHPCSEHPDLEGCSTSYTGGF